MNPIQDKVPERLVGPDGHPLFGCYQGAISDASLQYLSGAHARGGLAKLRSEKRWHFIGISTESIFASMAIIKMGYASAAFVYVFDRAEGRFLLDESVMGLPGPMCRIQDHPIDGASSAFRLPGMRLSLLGPSGEGLLHVRANLSGGWPALDIAIELDTAAAPTAMTAICPVHGQGSVNLTVKQVAMPVRGRILVDDRRIDLDGSQCWGLLDYTHGYLDRNTNWMWACAGGPASPRAKRRVGFNLCAGHNENVENVIWIGDEMYPVSPVQFHRGTEGPDAPWQMKSDDGEVDLTFRPEGMRSEDRDMGIVANHFMQPVGTFHGSLRDKRNRKVTIDGLAGICEEHASRW
ncbi:MAG: DUF2804 domain-containing protein [Deltaproteobacteria bacterium]|nr:DUF2804 domain-containing protein [Deltaproteobacteria bacterium]